MFSTLSKTGIIILATFIVSSANALNLVMSKILSFGIELKKRTVFCHSCFFAQERSFLKPRLFAQERSLLKPLWETVKMLVTSIFSFSYNVFYPIKDRNHHFSYIYCVVCKCFQFGHVQNFVVWYRVKKKDCILSQLFFCSKRNERLIRPLFFCLELHDATVFTYY